MNEIGIIIVTCVVIPMLGYWFHKLQQSLDQNTSASNALRVQMTQMSEHIAAGLEPRVKKCEDSIEDLYDRSEDHNTRISILECSKD